MNFPIEKGQRIYQRMMANAGSSTGGAPDERINVTIDMGSTPAKPTIYPQVGGFDGSNCMNHSNGHVNCADISIAL